MTDKPFVQSEAHADVQISRFNIFIVQFDLFSYQNPKTALPLFEILRDYIDTQKNKSKYLNRRYKRGDIVCQVVA